MGGAKVLTRGEKDSMPLEVITVTRSMYPITKAKTDPANYASIIIKAKHRFSPYFFCSINTPTVTAGLM